MSNILANNQKIASSHKIATLHESYTKASKCQIDEEQFVTLLTFYPAMLVVGADGSIDDEESIYVKHIAKFMANNYGESHSQEVRSLEKQFDAALHFLYEHQSQWEAPFLQVLHNYLQEIPLLKENIAEVMLMFADSSHRISAQENKVIRDVAEFLEIDIALFDLN